MPFITNVTLPNDTTPVDFDLPFDIGVFDINVSSYINDRSCAKFTITKSNISISGQ